MQREYTDVINTKFDGAIYISGNSYYTATNNNDSLIIYELLPTSYSFKKVAAYATGKVTIRQFTNVQNLTAQGTDKEKAILQIKNGSIKKNVDEKETVYNLINAETYPMIF
ncbi:MAG: hypothetical protein IPH56_14710 [Chitinophagaceae bacterium]|nr:hypothetical protein [Chitinophagaceae bacterium]